MAQPTSFGNYIDTIVQLEHKPLESKKGLTDYISKERAKQSGLSGRQIQRMRAYQDQEFPEGDAVTKLIKALPELETLRPHDICNRLLLPWQNIQRDQDYLTKEAIATGQHNKISIVAGWTPPQGLSNQVVAISIVNNIASNFRYEFIFPPLQSHPSLEEKQAKVLIDQWLRNLGKIVEINWYSQQAEKFSMANTKSLYDLYEPEKNNDRDYDLDSEFSKFKVQLAENIKFTVTPAKTNFWLLMPSPYVVLYNLTHTNKDASLKFGAFLVEGLTLRPVYEDIQTINSKGWLYIYGERYNQIEDEYQKIQDQCQRKCLKDLDR